VPFDSADAPNRQFLFSLLKAFRTVFVGGSHPLSAVDELFQRIVGGVLERSRAALLLQTHDEDEHRILDVLLDLISTFGDDLFTGVDQAEVGCSFQTTRRPIYICFSLRRSMGSF